MDHVFEVQGMSCRHCVQAIERALRALDPQARVEIDLEAGRVRVESALPRPTLAEAIRAEGYGVAS
ncbi:MAG: cation transporter [Tepidimonas sp.]|uniref:heavy-metal-associated domain-containing protein n=1 Tax=Tepidimonas sp. TaxID=2002775 RepID=UPI00298F37CB|nr:cation transporter [Tepidimonas sp.]MCS6809774.1 cation transporter [Tepidimonas sp.]MDW8335858.1 cation transporter [Tepidimonas sp.]